MTIFHRVKIERIHREHNDEADCQLTDKTELYLAGCSAEVWASILPGRIVDHDTFVYNTEQNKIRLNIPAAPWGANGINSTAPLIEAYQTTLFGRDATLITTTEQTYPCLEIVRTGCKDATGKKISFTQIAKQIAPVIGIEGKWDEPALRKDSLRWKNAKIEYKLLPMISNRVLLPVKDYDGCIRNLLEIRQDPDMVLPFSFAQNAKDYCVPKTCNFSFEASWYFLNSEYLKIYKNAQIIITNELGVVLGNKPDEHCIVLGYVFGGEMIAHLNVEGVRYRSISLLVIETPDRARFRKNLQEVVTLLARFCELDVSVRIVYAKCTYADDGLVRRKCEFAEKELELNFVSERYDVPFSISKDELIKIAMTYQILIPDNIRLDRHGRIPERKQMSLIADMIDSGNTSVVLAHRGVDVSLVSGSIAAGIHGYTGYVFPEHWKIIKGCSAVVLTASGSQAGIEKTVKRLHTKSCPLYTLPTGTKVEIEQRLSAIRHETGANIFIFAGSKILTEQKKLLEAASFWAQKTGVGMLICCSVNGSAGCADFMDEICWRKFHVLHLPGNDLTYLMKEDDPFAEEPQIFKLVLKCGTWTEGALTENDKSVAMRSLPVEQDYGEQKTYQEDERKKQLKNMI